MNIRLSLCIPFALLLLTACGQNNGPGGGGLGGDSYVNAVSTIADSAPDDSAPVDVESLTISLPEDSEPQVIS